jgi:hypothetical protein
MRCRATYLPKNRLRVHAHPLKAFLWMPFLLGWMVDDGLTVEKLDLQTALRQGVVQAEFTSSGGSSANCMSVKLRNKGSKSVVLTIPAGIQLAHPDVQDILVTREEVIALAPNAQTTASLYGFCLEPSSDTPATGDRFTLVTDQPHADKWKALASILSQKNLSPDEEQSVVWASTEDFPLAGLRVNEAAHPDLVEWLEETREEELPCYRLDYGELTNRRFDQQLIEVRGILQYAAEDDFRKSTLVVKAPDGEIVMTVFDGDPIEAGTYYRFRFNIRGSMLARGTYTMVLSSGAEVLKTVDIAV